MIAASPPESKAQSERTQPIAAPEEIRGILAAHQPPHPQFIADGLDLDLSDSEQYEAERAAADALPVALWRGERG